MQVIHEVIHEVTVTPTHTGAMNNASMYILHTGHKTSLYLLEANSGNVHMSQRKGY